MSHTVLILGASGRFGRNAAEQFTKAGWNVRRFDRATDTLMTAAQGADVIVNAWNPEYPDWATQVPALHASVIEAARQARATVIIPGNVYVFGEDTPAPWSERSSYQAKNPLGRIRIEMEEAYRRSGVRTIILRAGDFLDTQASGNWFDMIMTKRLSKGVFTYTGNPNIPHAWAYLPDLCRAAVQLAEKRADLPVFSDIPFPGYTLTGEDLRAGLQAATQGPIRLKQMSWLPIRLAGVVWPMGRCLTEMSYLWNTPHSLDGALFDDLLPGFDHTPLHQAIASAIPASLTQTQIDPNQPVAAGI